MAAPISNFVRLVPGTPVRLHFNDHAVVRRTVTDPVRNVPVERESLLFYADRVDGAPTDKTYSILSEKHAAEFAGYLPGKAYTRYDFVVLKEAPGFVPPRIVQVIPL